MTLTLESSAFTHHQMIPAEYTCKSQDYSPELHWHGAPETTQSFVLIMDDPDAPNGTWDHWIWFNIPATVNQLTKAANIPAGAVSGINSWGKQNYGGPCPPSGTHRYFFKLYALDSLLKLEAEATKAEVLNAMQGHILAQAELMGLFKK